MILLFLFFLWGILTGLIVGFTSIGTGLIASPGLIIIFGFDPVTAVGTMGLAGGIMMITSTIQHIREKNVLYKIAINFCVTAIPASFITANFADKINSIIPLKFIIGSVIIISVSFLFYRYVIMNPKFRVLEIKRWKLFVTPFAGIILGIIIGATSISGSIILILFLIILKLPSPIAVGTTSAVACVSLTIAAIAHVLAGHIDWNAIIGLIPGALLGGTIGAMFVNRMPRQILRYAILIILFAAGILVLVKR